MTAPGGSSTGPCFTRWRPVRVRTKREQHHCSPSQGRDHARREPDEPARREPDEPARREPDEPARREPDEPARREPDEPVAVTGQSRAPSKRQPPGQPQTRYPPLSTPPPRTDPSLSTRRATLPRVCTPHDRSRRDSAEVCCAGIRCFPEVWPSGTRLPARALHGLPCRAARGLPL